MSRVGLIAASACALLLQNVPALAGIPYKIVTAHRGRIELQSVVGEGTEFTVRLPLAGPTGRRT